MEQILSFKSRPYKQGDKYFNVKITFLGGVSILLSVDNSKM